LIAGVAGIWLRGAHRFCVAALCLLVLCTAAALSAHAQDDQPLHVQGQPQSAQTLDESGFSSGALAGGGRIAHILVTGTQRIEPDTVRSYLVVQPGDVFDPETIDTSLKRLFATGLFADVVMKRQGNNLVVHVVENPIINRVVFEGNHSKNDKKLNDEVQVRPRQVFTRARVQADVGRILELYRRSGRFAAKVTPKVVELPQNRVDLIFEISEGPVTKVAKINFVGNHAFTDRTLRQQIVTRESRIWTMFSSNDNYDPDRVAYDAEKLRKFYLAHGYADFSVVSTNAELTPDGSAFVITYTVDEGPQYKFGKVTVETTLQELDPKFLERAINIQPGQTYNADRLDSASDTITFLAGTVGYAFVDVKRSMKRDTKNHTIAVRMEVNEGPRVYVERINIRGNTSTLDKVIRREIRIAEGDAYNRVLIDRSKTRIRALGFFKDVKIDNEPGSRPDRTILDVAVEEQPTGELSLGLGVSSQEFTGDLQISQSNFLGRGQSLQLNVSASTLREQISLQFTDPYFLDRSLLAGFSIYKEKADYINISGFSTDSLGAGVNFGFPLTEYSRLSLKYAISQTRVDVASSACSAGTVSLAICDQVGTASTSLIGYRYSLDTRNDPINPSRGAVLSFSQDFAGLGGTDRFLRTEVGFADFIPIYKNTVILQFSWRAGFLWGFSGERVRLDQRFFKGGDSFRGFEIAGIGPRDLLTRDSLGGQAYGIGSIDLHVPTGLPEDYGVKAALFVQAGTLGYLSRQSIGAAYRSRIDDSMGIRASAGVSFSWKSPFGPVRIDIAKAFKREPYDKPQIFRFSAGTVF
jgi:outer membrane protein insertion porin family